MCRFTASRQCLDFTRICYTLSLNNVVYFTLYVYCISRISMFLIDSVVYILYGSGIEPRRIVSRYVRKKTCF